MKYFIYAKMVKTDNSRFIIGEGYIAEKWDMEYLGLCNIENPDDFSFDSEEEAIKKAEELKEHPYPNVEIESYYIEFLKD